MPIHTQLLRGDQMRLPQSQNRHFRRRSQMALIACSATAALSARSMGATFTPISVLPGSFNQDMVVEASSPQSGATADITASMDTGTTNLNNNVWYEKGYYSGNTSLGLPTSGSTFTSQNDNSHIYTMQSYGTPGHNNNNALLIGNDGGVTTARPPSSPPRSSPAAPRTRRLRPSTWSACSVAQQAAPRPVTSDSPAPPAVVDRPRRRSPI
jgi:hypothetical protein